VVDVGCGTGDNLGALDGVAGRTVAGVELSEYAVRHAPRSAGGRGRAGVARAEHLPFPTACADLVTSMDVIEHLDDDAALAEYRRVVRSGGLVLLTVPAYQWLWSDHDTWAAHRRRYSRRTLVAAVERAGLRTRRVTYFNSFLVPPAAVLRRTPVRRLVKGEQDEVGASSPAVDRVMTGLAGLERRWARRRAVPFGLSIVCLAGRP
jgi:SAM-dependent methyltransferase